MTEKIHRYTPEPRLSEPFYARTKMLIGENSLRKLLAARVVVCGLGGVGSAAAEALARAGVGNLRLIDFDSIDPSNLNRQLHTNRDNIGQPKALALKARLQNINAYCELETGQAKLTAENMSELIGKPDYVLDAIDDAPAKIALALYCHQQNIPLVMSMGTGNKLHPELFELADISKTSVCPLAKKIRVSLKKQGIEQGITVVYSKESPTRADTSCNTPASISFVPPVAGMILAGQVIRDLAGLA